MKLNDRWEIRQGPMGNDYCLVEKTPYYSEKYKEERIRETPRYYPNLKMLAKSLANLEGINAIQYDSIEEVLAYLKDVEQAVLDSSRVA